MTETSARAPKDVKIELAGGSCSLPADPLHLMLYRTDYNSQKAPREGDVNKELRGFALCAFWEMESTHDDSGRAGIPKSAGSKLAEGLIYSIF